MIELIFVNRYFYPDHSATSQILADLAFDQAGRGRRVSVVTSRQLYGDASVRLPRFETINGVAVHRVWTSRRGRGGVGRMMDYSSFHVAAALKVLRLSHAASIVVAKTDPPMLGVTVGFAARRRGAATINWLQDLYPEVALALGVPIGPMLSRILVRMRNRALHRAVMNVAIGNRMAAILEDTGIPRDRLRIIPNWADDESIVPLSKQDNLLRSVWGFQSGDFIVGYSGNLGRAHEFETVVGAAELLRGDPGIKFLVVGSGGRRPALEQAVVERGLKCFTFKDYQPRDQLVASLSVPDVHWLSLRPELEGLIVPSKMYGIAAAGRPVITVGALDGELAGLVTGAGAGIAVAQGDAAGFAEAVLRLRRSNADWAVAAAASRRIVDRAASRRMALDRWDDLLSALAPAS